MTSTRALADSPLVRLFGAITAATALPLSGASAYNLAWNTNTTGNFVGAQTWSYDNAGVLTTTDNPFSLVGVPGSGDPNDGGKNIVLIGAGGTASLNTPAQGPFALNALWELRVGTTSGDANFGGLTPPGPDLRGSGALTIENVDLLLFDDEATESTGRLIVGGGTGVTGTVDFNSTGMLRTQGHLRVGQNGTGVLNQNGGLIRASYRPGDDRAVRFGASGGTGTVNLNDGAMEVGALDDGIGLPLQVPLQVGYEANSVGTFNVGNGTGAAGSATFDAWGTSSIGMNGGSGVLNIASDGVFRINYPTSGVSAQLRLGQSGGASDGTINQTGGTLQVDGLLELGFNTGAGSYVLNGSTGTASVRSISANDASSFTFNLDAGGATKVSVLGNAGSGDVASGNSISLANTTLNLGGLASTPLTSITLFEQADSSATLSGSFDNYLQGAPVGLNASSQQLYLNYFGGDGNDIVLQNTIPSSSIAGLVWNVGAANMDAGWAKGNGSFGVAASGVNPFGTVEDLYLGKGGHATYDGTTSDPSSDVKNLYVGTNRGAGVIAGTAGNGTLTVNGAENLTVVATTDTTQGNAYIGEKGFTGTVNWDSTGTFDAQGQLRVGIDGGTGIVNQTAGVVQGGKSTGTGKYLAVGEGVGSTGTYNLNGGQFLPDGIGAGTPLRQFHVALDGGTGTFNVGDGIGAADSAELESEDDLNIGRGAGSVGQMTVKSDGRVELPAEGAPLQVGSAGGTGTVLQTGGTVIVSDFSTIGEGSGSVGVYEMTGGSFTADNINTPTATPDNRDAFRVGGGGGDGTLRIGGNAVFLQKEHLIIAQSNNSGSEGLLEMIGSQASVTVGRLENHIGANNDETIRWVADANGVTPLTVTATGAARVQLQNSAEVTANAGTGFDVIGNGIALELDLSAFTGSGPLTLIDHRAGSVQVIQGLFEQGTTGNLYGEGESILGTGYAGTVTISYLGSAPTGSTGNDVVLNLTPGTVNDADFDGDGDVDGSDFLTWQRGVGINSGATNAQGDADGNGAVNGADLNIWKGDFGPAAQPVAGAVPEPASALLTLAAIGGALAITRRRR